MSLGGFVFSTNNSGVWQNDSWVSFGGTPSWANVSKVLSSVVGAVVGYRWFVNDSSGVWVDSGVKTLTVQASPLIFSDGFESDNYSNWNGQTISGSNTLSISSAHVNSGGYSSLFTIVSSSSGTVDYLQKNIANNNVVYLKYYVYFTSFGSLTSGNRGLTSYLVPSGKAGYGGGVEFYNNGGTFVWALEDGARNSISSTAITLNVWHSVELMYNYNTSTMELWVDNNTAITWTGATFYPNINAVQIGEEWTSANENGAAFYVDDVVVATSYIGSVSVGVGSPVVSNVSAGPVLAGGSCVFSSFWSDNVSLGGFVFSTNNTGVWQNDSWVSFGGTPSWANVSKVLSSVVGGVVGYRWFVNDSSGVWVDSGVKTLTVQASPLIFSDGFESGGYGAWTGMYSSGSTLGVSVNYAHSGTYSNKITISSNTLGNGAYTYERVTANNTLYGREYVYFASFGSLASGHRGSILTIYDSLHYGPRIWVCFINVSGTFKWGLNDGDIISNVSIPLNTWISVETSYNSQTHLGSLWINGVAVITGYTSNNIGSGTTVDQIWSGEAYSDVNEGGATYYLDDAAIAKSYIGPINASRLVFSVGANQSLVAGQVSSVVTVQRQDQYGNPVTSGDLSVSFGSNSAGGVFYSDVGSTVVSSVKIVSGSSSVSFWYSDAVVGSSVLTVSSLGLVSANTTFTIGTTH